MWDLSLNFIKRFIVVGFLILLFPSFLGAQSSMEIKDPHQNMGFLLIQKELLRESDKPKNKWTIQEQQNYRGWLFLEAYFLKNGIDPWSMKVVHRIETMKRNILIPDDSRKAFLECEAWRVLDYSLKNNEKKELVQELIKEKFTRKDYIYSRQKVSYKVSQCIDYIDTNWTWKGPPYTQKEVQYDIKAKNMVESMKTYIKIKNANSP